MWTDAQLELLIKERKENNVEYHDLVCNGKMQFWKAVSTKINLEFGTNYSGKRCREKFQSLVRAYNVSKMYTNLLLLKVPKLIYHIIVY
jgi:hypothetical protein